jgi:hypothetical protein
MLPGSIRPALEEHLRRVRAIHQQDLADGFGEAPLPNTLARKYPRAASEWGWQYVFPASSRWRDPATDRQGRHHLHERTVPIGDVSDLTDRKSPGHPSKSYRSREPLRVTGEITDWQEHSPEALKAMKDFLEQLARLGAN